MYKLMFISSINRIFWGWQFPYTSSGFALKCSENKDICNYHIGLIIKQHLIVTTVTCKNLNQLECIIFGMENLLNEIEEIYLYCVQSGIRKWVSLLIDLFKSDSRCVKTDRKKWIKFINSNLLRTKNNMMNWENNFNPDHTY